MLIIATGLIALLYPAEDLFYPLDFPRRGDVARDDIIATSSFKIAKSSKVLQEEEKEAVDAIPIILDYNSDLINSLKTEFDRFSTLLSNAARKYKPFLNDSTLTDSVKAVFMDSLINNISREFPILDKGIIERRIKTARDDKMLSIVRSILVNGIYFVGVMPDLNQLPDLKSPSVIIRIGKRETYMVRDSLLDLSKAYVKLLSMLNDSSRENTLNVDDSYNIARHFISPNLNVNYEEISIRQAAAKAEISAYSDEISAGDVIVRSGDLITARQAKILDEMYKHEESTPGEQQRFSGYLLVAARLLLVLAAFLILYLYLYNYHPRIYRSNPKLLALFFIFGVELLLVYLLGVKLGQPIYVYPVAILAILVTVLFDAQIGMVCSFVLALLLGVLHRFNFPIVLITMIIGVVSCYSIQGVKQRSEFFKSIMMLSIVYLILTLILESFNVTPSEETLKLVGLAVGNALISPILAMGILPVFESLFGFTTNVTLLELSDLNRPLLKRLALEAPGTYHHSILVGNLAEAAAKAINANPLLARVGAYYHDIGKMEIPEYFVENQLGIKSRHDSLTPSMSAIVLSSHLKKGRIIGEHADLPDEILNFIEEHHGTMTMTYFYNKAKELSGDNTSVDEFKYPGPKPQIRETAVVMLADSVEAASRTLADPKPARLRNLVQGIINDRFQSGELEECPLTLRDLAQIRESFVQILIGVFHHRVEYPKDEKPE